MCGRYVYFNSHAAGVLRAGGRAYRPMFRLIELSAQLITQLNHYIARWIYVTDGRPTCGAPTMVVVLLKLL